MTKVLEPIEVFDAEQYQNTLKKLQINLDRANAVLRAYKALELGVGEIQIEEFGKLISNPEGFVREKVLDREIEKLNGMAIDRAKFAEMVSIPDLTALKHACKYAQDCVNLSHFYTVKGGEVVISKKAKERAKEAATVRLTTEKQQTVFEAARTIAHLADRIKELCADQGSGSIFHRPLDGLFYYDREGYKADAKEISKL
jgi:hypothetical protein